MMLNNLWCSWLIYVIKSLDNGKNMNHPNIFLELVWSSQMILTLSLPSQAVCYFMSILVLQSSWWERESWSLCLVCLSSVSCVVWLFLTVTWGLSSVCDCNISWSNSLTIFVICPSGLLMFLDSLYCKQYRPRSNCSQSFSGQKKNGGWRVKSMKLTWVKVQNIQNPEL